MEKAIIVGDNLVFGRSDIVWMTDIGAKCMMG